MRERSTQAQRVVLVLVLALLLMAVGVEASESPYTSLQDRGIKALSPDQIAGYEAGEGMGFALAAELNGYPGPKHVLELQDELSLTESQAHSTESIFVRMKESAEDLGHQIVEQEEELDRLFASHNVDAETLSAHVSQIADLEGRLRVTHLQAHLEMMSVLTHDQIRKYIGLRGYHDGGSSGHLPDSHGEHN